VTISSWLNFGGPAPPGRGLRRGENFWLHLTTASEQGLRLSEHFFHFFLQITQYIYLFVRSFIRPYVGPFVCSLIHHLRKGGYVFIGIIQFVCQQDFAKTTRLTFTKFGGKVAHGPREVSLDFVGNPHHVPLKLQLRPTLHVLPGRTVLRSNTLNILN